MITDWVPHQVRATKEKLEVNKSFNPWRTGVQEVDPSVARDFFTQTCLNHAADYDLRVFLSNPFVAAHMLDTFWPTQDFAKEDTSVILSVEEAEVEAPSCASTLYGAVGRALGRACQRWSRIGLDALVSALAHVIALPLMLFIPRSTEVLIEESMRFAISQPGRKPSRWTPTIIWFIPAGRFALFCFAILGLAMLCAPDCICVHLDPRARDAVRA